MSTRSKPPSADPKRGADAPRAYDHRIYGRKHDRPLRARQRETLEAALPRLAAPDPDIGQIDPAMLFPDADEIWLEIGFGGGEHLLHQAQARPDVGLIGAEPFLNGVAKAVMGVVERDLGNVRIHHGDARPLLEALPDASIAKLFLLYPDPWPKKRHAKRRMVNPWFVAEAARVVKPGGIMRIASDIGDYISWTLMHVTASDAFRWTAQSPADWRGPWLDWPGTRYEAKAQREGRTPTYLTFQRASAEKSA